MDARRFLVFVFLLSISCLQFSVAAPSGEQRGGNNPVISTNTTKGSQANKAEAKRSPEAIKLLKDAESVKQELIKLNQDLYNFEEQLLYPTETQLAVFLSLNENATFTLDSIELLLDGKLVATHLYQESELDALEKGGIQKVYLGSLADGRHKLTAQFNGQGADKSYFRRKKALKFTKENKAKYIQIEISESNTKREPLFKVKQW